MITTPYFMSLFPLIVLTRLHSNYKNPFPKFKELVNSSILLPQRSPYTVNPSMNKEIQ